MIKLWAALLIEDFNNWNVKTDEMAREFGVKGVNPLLSYSVPNKNMFATKDKTPPVLVTSEVGLQYYLKTLRENMGLNLFVKFEEKVDTPNLSCETLGDEEFMDALHDVEEKIARSGGLKSNEDVIVDDEDDIFVDDLFMDNKTEDTEDGIDISDDTMPCGGYDKEFWGNFLSDDYGDSNAEELMSKGGVDARYKGKNNIDVSFQGLNDKVGTSADKVVQCTDSGVFDHALFVSGGGSSVNAEKVKTEWAAKTKVGCRAGSSHGLRGGARKLEEIDDEESDIPPLFEDIEYEVENIPDLDIEDDGKGICKGKVYASKEDCQIGLAIYAIKNMYHFKQTRTKWNYFVLSCSDEKCDWRILATLMKGTGYYEIKKASLDHTCSLDTRGQFMQKATSKVIASVFKAKYSDPTMVRTSNGLNVKKKTPAALEKTLPLQDDTGSDDANLPPPPDDTHLPLQPDDTHLPLQPDDTHPSLQPVETATLQPTDFSPPSENKEDDEATAHERSPPLCPQDNDKDMEDTQPLPPEMFYFKQTNYTECCKLSSRSEENRTMKEWDDILAEDEKNWFSTHLQFKHIWHMHREENHKYTHMWMLLLCTAPMEIYSVCWFVVNGVPVRRYSGKSCMIWTWLLEEQIQQRSSKKMRRKKMGRFKELEKRIGKRFDLCERRVKDLELCVNNDMNGGGLNFQASDDNRGCGFQKEADLDDKMAGVGAIGKKASDDIGGSGFGNEEQEEDASDEEGAKEENDDEMAGVEEEASEQVDATDEEGAEGDNDEMAGVEEETSEKVDATDEEGAEEEASNREGPEEGDDASNREGVEEGDDEMAEKEEVAEISGGKKTSPKKRKRSRNPSQYQKPPWTIQRRSNRSKP
ncbi:Transposase MuDR plant [Arabidopsis thaliana x Arabidopsis arenosa]|uniref:Transposase MuDR plant n=1 Tax=Arabidopsis thaliana x Arabidopsis arenosa TaxID=1240361 RepID=A0A8T2EUR1_9BRAS|nr:Transposase MuDR plant [Arabidopsis thaliana x Arabidopsis arenosa]